MEKTNASKQGVLHWLDENFEKMFLVTGLLSITLFITWQVIYRYILPRPERRHQKAFVHPGGHAL